MIHGTCLVEVSFTDEEWALLNDAAGVCRIGAFIEAAAIWSARQLVASSTDAERIGSVPSVVRDR